MHGQDHVIPREIINIVYRFHCNKLEYNWTKIKSCTLKQPMVDCGYLIYDRFLITFGGKVYHGVTIDNIYILDLRELQRGWMESSTKCPEKNEYRAILTSQNIVHLMNARSRDGPCDRNVVHCSTHLSSILPLTEL